MANDLVPGLGKHGGSPVPHGVWLHIAFGITRRTGVIWASPARAEAARLIDALGS
jgi:hypothetical protein